jgi:iron-sulfur cluster repair protein YtfE (RIC family)
VIKVTDLHGGVRDTVGMRRHAGLIPLSHDHQHALALCVMADRDANAAHAAAKIIETFDSEILDHFRFEEQVLFPMLAGFAALSDLISELTAEHVQITALLTQLRRESDRETVTKLCTSLRDHVRKEESVLFEQAQGLLSAGQLQDIHERRVGTNMGPR